MKMQRRKIDIIIAIDPDVEKNGVAYLNCENKNLEISTLSFPELLDYLRYVQRCAETTQKHLVVVVEAGYMNKGNWHLNPKDTKAAAAAKGNHAGRNHETARKIVEMCKHWQMEVKEVKPLEKCWKGKTERLPMKSLPGLLG